MTSKWNVTGAVCLTGASVGALVQYLVTPIGEGDSAAAQVAAAAAHLTRMRWAVVLDLPILLTIPALLYVGWLAGARTSRLAAMGTGLTFAVALGAVAYLLALDPLLYAAALQPDRAAATGVVSDYLGNSLVTAVVVAYLAGHVVGFVLLADALRRARVVPLWAAVAMGLWPLAEMAGGAAGARWLAAAGYGLLVVAFGACAAALIRSRPIVARPAPAPPRTAVAPSRSRAASGATRGRIN